MQDQQNAIQMEIAAALLAFFQHSVVLVTGRRSWQGRQ